MKQKAIICDLDGTLAILNGRSPYDASTAMEDVLNEPVANILSVYDNQTLFDIDLILLTGRYDTYRKQTIEWLAKHKITHYKQLYMRSATDKRQDTIFKKEIYEKYIKNEYDVIFVLEDRNQVVDMWRKELGLTCLQVEYGDF